MCRADQGLLPGAQRGQVHGAEGKGVHLHEDPRRAGEGGCHNSFLSFEVEPKGTPQHGNDSEV